MIGQAFSTVINAILNVFGIFDTLMVKTGAWAYIFGIIVAMLVLRFIVYPFLKEGIASPEGSKTDGGK